jgi:thioredoxin-like negative regulator of GroEL
MQGREDEIAYREVDLSKDRGTFDKYGVQATPTIIVLDPAGDIVDFFVGVPEESELKRAIEQAVM